MPFALSLVCTVANKAMATKELKRLSNDAFSIRLTD